MFARDDLIREALALEPLPTSSSRLAKLLADDDWTLEDVGRTAALDEVLTGMLLRQANSALNGGQVPIASVGTAVMRLGPGLVLSIALGKGVKGSMSTALPAYGVDEGGLFRHSVASALAIEAMRGVGLKPPGGCFVAALVHDVGKLVIGRKLESMGIRLSAGNPDSPWMRDEAEQMGIDHAELSGEIARAWELPGDVPEAVAGHHNPAQIDTGLARTMAQFVSAADAIANSLDLEEGEAQFDPAAQMNLGFQPADQERVREKTRQLLDDIMQLYV